MVRIRRFAAQDAAPVAALIATTMRTSNAADYPPAVLEPLIAYFTPAQLLALSAERHMLVAEEAGEIVGTAALDGAALQTCFVRPDRQGRGIGRQLLRAVEEIAAAAGLATLSVASSLTAVGFYERAGYRRAGAEFDGTGGRQLPMAKQLPRGGPA